MSRPVVRAAGAVLWRPGADGPEVALVHRPKYDDWSLPKGKADPGEHDLAAAVREVAEETGHGVALGRPLGSQRYPVTTTRGEPADKVVRYWAARAVDGDSAFAANQEIDDLRWLPLPRAAQALTWERDAQLLQALHDGPLATVPLLVLRHAIAAQRSAWKGSDDEKRPLTDEGEAQAVRLVPLLGAYGIRRVVSSPSVRCEQTVAPYAAAADTAVETDVTLTEPAHEVDACGACAAIDRLLRDGEPTVVCSHRPVLPTLTGALAEHADVTWRRKPLRKAELLVCHVADGRVVAAERHRP